MLNVCVCVVLVACPVFDQTNNYEMGKCVAKQKLMCTNAHIRLYERTQIDRQMRMVKVVEVKRNYLSFTHSLIQNNNVHNSVILLLQPPPSLLLGVSMCPCHCHCLCINKRFHISSLSLSEFVSFARALSIFMLHT